MLFSPNLVGSIFVGVMFNVMLTPRYGLINRTIHALVGWGLEKHWVEEPALVMPALVISSLWLYVGFNMVYFLAALQTVDKELEQAARIDGAGPLQVFWNVTLPSIRHVVIFVVILSTVGSFNLFELPLATLNLPAEPEQPDGADRGAHIYQPVFARFRRVPGRHAARHHPAGHPLFCAPEGVHQRAQLER